MKKYSFVIIVLIAILGLSFFLYLQKPEAIKQVTTKVEDQISPAQKTVTSADNAPTGTLHNLPVPTPVAIARKAAAQLLKIPEGEAIVMTAYEKEWPNSCLGLPKKDEMCAQVVTSGYEVTVQGNGKNVIYRTNQDGSVIRLQDEL